MMMWIAVLLTVYAYATPIPPTPVPALRPSFNHIRHLVPGLPPGASARISAQGNSIPCWDSPAALTAFTQAYQSTNQAAERLQAANDSFFLEEGDRVRSLATQGMLGQITRLKMLGGDHAGAVCYIQSPLKIYRSIKLAKHRDGTHT